MKIDCERCRPMAEADCKGQPWRLDFQYRRVRNLHHAMRWHDTGELGPHLEDPYLL